MSDGETIDVGYVHVLTEHGGPCVPTCPHPEHTALWPDGRESWHDGDIAARRLADDEDDDVWLVIRPMLFTLRVGVMSAGNAGIEFWCYPDLRTAIRAWLLYPDMPPGFTRHHER